MKKNEKQLIRRTQIKGSVNQKSKIAIGNDLITAAQSLSNRAQRIVKIILAQLNDRTDELLPSVTFYKKDLTELLRLQNTNDRYSLLDETLTELNNSGVRFINDDGISYMSWFTTAKLFKNGNIRMKLNNDLKPYVLQLQNQFTKLPLEPYMNFKLDYTIPIFDLIMKDFNLKKSFSKSKDGTKYVSIKYYDMRLTLGLDDPKTKKKLKLVRWPDFRRKALEPAVEEISEKSDYMISWEAMKKGRATETIIFHITPDKYKLKTKKEIQGIEEPNDAFIALNIMLEKCSESLKDKVKELQAEKLTVLIKENKKKPKALQSKNEILETRAIDIALEEYREKIEIEYRGKK